MEKFDLHMHSNISRDGEFTPTQLIEMAHEVGLQYVALSDHNDFRGIGEMKEAAKQKGIHVIPTIECDSMLGDQEVHVLAYNIDYTHPYYQDLAQRIDEEMDKVMSERFVLFHKNYGVIISEEEVYAKTPKDENPFFTLVDMMLNDPKNKNIEDFQEYLPGGKRSSPQVVNFYWDKCSLGTKNYVEIKYPDFKTTVDMIHATGGIAVLAHPWRAFYQNEQLLQKAIDLGIDGIEAYSNYHDDYHNEYYDNYCREHNLIMTCGSDFHGSKKPKITLGEYGYQKDDGDTILTAFLNAIGPIK